MQQCQSSSYCGESNYVNTLRSQQYSKCYTATSNSTCNSTLCSWYPYNYGPQQTTPAASDKDVAIYTPMWVEGMVAGRGWIAIALVVFATWRPMRVMIGAYLFGGCMIAQMFVQGSGVKISIPAQFLSALPYLATIVVLVAISRNRSTIRLNSPASLGQPFLPDA